MHPAPLTLMYHSVTTSPRDIPPDRETGGALYEISLETFKSQMEFLRQSGLGPEDVVITFDDGEKNNFQHAFPVLKEMGFSAWFFVIVKRIGTRGYMSYKDLKELQKSGMTVGSHGLTHEILTNLLDSQMEEELRASRQALEINLGTPVKALSIPRGFCSEKIIATAHRLGYETVFISQRPSGLRSPAISRVAVKSNWTLPRFAQALQGRTPFLEALTQRGIQVAKAVLRESGYNWMRSAVIKLSS